MKYKILYTLSLLFISSTIFSQSNRKVEKIAKDYERFSYIEVIKTYERLYEKGISSPDLLLKLGNSYYFNANLEKAVVFYKELYKRKPEQSPEFYYRYSQSLKGNKEYKKADEIMAKFIAKSGKDSRALLFTENKDYLAEIRKNSGRFKIENAGINSKYSDYGIAFIDDKVVFCSARDTSSIFRRNHSWTGQSFTNLYSAKLAEDGSLTNIEKFSNKLNSKFHESTPIFTKDGKTVYFTRNNFLKKRGYDGNEITLLKIYKATLDESGNWSNITTLPFNNDRFQCAHPALSPDEKTMYFASDMPGTIGKSDLYKVDIAEDGSFGEPINLGKAINTEGRETYPFISANNELYFSSDGRPGIGGLDIYGTKIMANGVFSKIQNIGEEANSPQDDFAFVINKDTKIGFLSSNREGGEGNDDIYKFLQTKELFIEQAIFGFVMNTASTEFLPDSKITLLDENFNKVAQTSADDAGFYEFTTLEPSTKYYIRVEKTDYETIEVSLTTDGAEGRSELNLQLEKSVQKLAVGTDIATVFKINLIYFDLDKWNIRSDAEIDLAKIADVMEQNPTMEIDIRSHTDSRESFEYNDKLSEKRAKSTMVWLISKGISKNRLTAKGFGESQLVNKCADEIPCSEEEHQQNRRSQFVIIAL